MPSQAEVPSTPNSPSCYHPDQFTSSVRCHPIFPPSFTNSRPARRPGESSKVGPTSQGASEPKNPASLAKQVLPESRFYLTKTAELQRPSVLSKNRHFPSSPGTSRRKLPVPGIERVIQGKYKHPCHSSRSSPKEAPVADQNVYCTEESDLAGRSG